MSEAKISPQIADTVAISAAPSPAVPPVQLSADALPAGAANFGASGAQVWVPGLGSRDPADHRRILFTLLSLAVVVFLAVMFFALAQADNVARQVAAAGQSSMQAQRLAKSASQALLGSQDAFNEVSESVVALTRNMRGLRDGDTELDLSPVAPGAMAEVNSALPLVDRAEKNALTLMSQRNVLTEVGNSLRSVNQQTSALLESAQAVSSLKLAQNAPTTAISASGQLVMLTQRIGKSANEFLTMDGVSPEAVFLLGKDLSSFKEIAQGLLDGSPELQLPATKDGPTRERLEALLKQHEETRRQAGSILGNLQSMVSAREAQALIVSESEPLRRQLETLQAGLSAQTGLGIIPLVVLVLTGLMAILAGLGLARVSLSESQQEQAAAEKQRLQAQEQEREAKRVNNANQAAILRLMNELQSVAEGDLTQEATVTEDITGAIADSVNYTVEELRSLVGNVQNTATRVAQTTATVETTSQALLTMSTQQLQEIRSAGQSVLDMAGRINEVSGQAQMSALVARQSLSAAETGLQAVQNTIGGMNTIRDQIQDTSKRLKRLGESSQEIGEITELISDITEQTNVLALNAAIQAASAGEAGRGFSVVAEEVQRLAERSAQATKQISTLVKAIQTDAQDAVAAMERSTQGVVEGAKLSDNAGGALVQIESVSRRLSQLIEDISKTTAKEAESANEVVGNIQNIFAVTEQAGESTRSTVEQVRDLARVAQELSHSVQRFKIG